MSTKKTDDRLVRAAAKEKRRQDAAAASGHVDPTKDKYLGLETKLGTGEYALAADIAADGEELNQATEPHLNKPARPPAHKPARPPAQ